MDPSIILTTDDDTLRTSKANITLPLKLDTHLKETKASRIIVEQNFVNSKADVPLVMVDKNRYLALQKIKDSFAVDNFLEARDATNPFENIGRSIFMNRAAVKLANIDAVFNVSGDTFTFDKKTSSNKLTFCDIAAGPGGFTQYLQYRYNNSFGYGMTLRSDKLDWNRSLIDMQRFIPFYGPKDNGDLYEGYDEFINMVLSKEPKGVDLVTADGGFDVEEDGDRSLLKKQEFLSSRLLLVQCLIGIRCTRVGGNFVVKVFDTVTEISMQIIYILCKCFNSVTIFKPVTSRPANAERYVICRDREAGTDLYYYVLQEAASKYTKDIYLSSIFRFEPDIEFTEWLTRQNNLSVERQLIAAQNILLYLNDQKPVIQKYNIPKFLTIWNLPDTPANFKHDKLVV